MSKSEKKLQLKKKKELIFDNTMKIFGEFELSERCKFNRVRNAKSVFYLKNKSYFNKQAFKEFLKYHRKNKATLINVYEN